MPSRHSNMESPRPSEAEAQEPQGTASFVSEELSSGPTLVPPPTSAESDQSDAVDVSPDEAAGLVGNIRRYFRLRRGRNHEFASRHVSPGRVRRHFGSAGRHAGLGLRQQIRGFASRQVDRYRRRRERRRRRREGSPLDNLLASRLARISQPNIEDPVSWERRRLENLLANRQARNSHHNIEDLISQQHDWTVLETRSLQLDEIESHSLPRPTSQIQIRAASLVNSFRSRDSNIAYYGTRHDGNKELWGIDNSDDEPSGDRGSQVRRGRSLRRAGSIVSGAPSDVRGSDHQSRDSSDEEARGRQLLRASSYVSDPWAELWGPINIPSDPSSQVRRSISLRRAGSIVNDAFSRDHPLRELSPQVRRGRSLRRAGSVVSDAFPEVRVRNHPSRETSYEEQRGRQLLRTSSIVTDPWAEFWGPVTLPNDPRPQEEGSNSTDYLQAEAGYDSSEERERLNLRVARWNREVQPFFAGEMLGAVDNVLHHGGIDRDKNNLPRPAPQAQTHASGSVSSRDRIHHFISVLRERSHSTSPNSGRVAGCHAGFDGANDEPDTGAGGARDLTGTGPGTDVNAGGSANEDAGEPSSSLRSAPPRSSEDSVDRGGGDGSSSSDENAGGDDDDTGWRCYPGVGGVGNERWRHRSGSHVTHIEEWDASSEDSDDSGGARLPFVACLTRPASPEAPTESDEELSTLAPGIIITPPDHEAQYTGEQWVNPHLLHPGYNALFYQSR
ncbi:unnamed protein product [Penicillium egyptiacum]|uniref:Uncharacterized protein n=1 Tax=Penicillium egyptiacum TaxID=1303716 RepID=A0A9W4KKC1_9EURO|nr:unnamed protein product [Penicillium egyptiacum]